MEDMNGSVTIDREQVSCKNCSTSFVGKYCPECGQSILDYDKPLNFIIADFAGNLFAFDTRVLRSFFTVIFKPGQYSLDYIEGRRARYMPPFRLYVFFSFIFMFLLSLNKMDLSAHNWLDKTDLFNEQDNEQSPISPEDSVFVNGLLPILETKISTTSQKINKLANADSIDNLVNNRLKELTLEYEDDLKFSLCGNEFHYDLYDIKTHPNIYVNQILSYFSWSMFLLMPFFALLLWIFFRKHMRHYISHLILSINIHTFSMVLLSIVISIFLFVPSQPIKLFLLPFLIMPIYCILSFKKLYNVRTKVATIRFCFVNSLYWLTVLVVNSLIVLVGLSQC